MGDEQCTKDGFEKFDSKGYLGIILRLKSPER
jgi:hypothetical protein